MKEQMNTSIVIKQQGFLMGYKVYATLWVDSEFEPLVETSQWALTRRKARHIASRYVLAIDAIKQLQEALRAGV